jgi:predicted ATPase/DNA-binding SARP family transcriptional activator
VLCCRTLGPIEVEVDGAVVELGGVVPRRVVAALSAADGGPVSDDALAELVWAERRPVEVVQALRVVIHRIRQALGSHASLLQRTKQGYVLAVSAEQTDHGRFVKLVDAGMAELESGNAGAAAKTLEAAMALWRGQPWAELGDALPIAAPRGRLIELRDVAVEELQAARLERGDTARAVAALSEAVTEAPYRERRWELLALGLYRSGRQAQALAELRRVRHLLTEELGIDPGQALRTLEQRMLNNDPSLLAGEPPHRAGPTRDDAHAQVRAFSAPSTAFIGREDDLHALAKLLVEHRMVTVVGPAGVGKTRLAIEYAAAQPDAWLVRLADVHSGDAITATVAAAIGLTYVAWDPMLAIVRAIGDRPGLLVLDNCEHLTNAVGRLAASLLSSCRGLRVLATSRRLLNVEAEVCLPLQPLPVDDGGGDGPAIALLLDRVQANRPNWHPSVEEHAAARTICLALDGLPLAIELAAARERAFGLPDIAAHIRDRLDILGQTPHGSISPHSSLQAAIGWSVEQLSEPDRALLLRLWPFEGGFTWQAVDAVRPRADASAILSTLSALVDRSLVTVDVSAGPARYRMLETLRRSCESIDPDPVASREAHATWVRTFATEQAGRLWGHGSADALRLLEAELPNIRAGIAHDLRHQPLAALRITGGLAPMWFSVGLVHEGIRLIRAALDACSDAPAEDRGLGLVALSVVTYHAGDGEAAVRLAEEAIALLQECADAHEALYLEALSRRCHAMVDLDRADREFRHAVAEFKHEVDRRNAPDYLKACALFGVALLRMRDGDLPGAEHILAEARRISQRCGWVGGEAHAEMLLAWGRLRQAPRPRGTTTAVISRLWRAIDAFQRQRNISDTLVALYAGAVALADLGEYAIAGQLRAAVLEQAARVGTNPYRFAPPGVDAALCQALSQHGDADGSNAPTSWAAMIELFTGAARRLTGALELAI